MVSVLELSWWWLLVFIKLASTLLVCLSRFSCVRLFATLWLVSRQALLSMGFPRPEYWSGLPWPPP